MCSRQGGIQWTFDAAAVSENSVTMAAATARVSSPFRAKLRTNPQGHAPAYRAQGRMRDH